MKEFHKDIVLNFTTGKKDLGGIAEDIKDKAKPTSDSFMDKFSSSVGKLTKTTSTLGIDLGDFGEVATKFAEGDWVGALLTGIKSIVTNINETIEDNETFMDRLLKESQMSNRETRELMFTYGFNKEEAIAWQETMKTMGLSGEEDLAFLDESELQQFQKVFTTNLENAAKALSPDEEGVSDLQKYREQTYEADLIEIRTSWANLLTDLQTGLGDAKRGIVNSWNDLMTSMKEGFLQSISGGYSLSNLYGEEVAEKLKTQSTTTPAFSALDTSYETQMLYSGAIPYSGDYGNITPSTQVINNYNTTNIDGLTLKGEQSDSLNRSIIQSIR